jgi:hypothetical protein
VEHESTVLCAIGWQITVPTVSTYLPRYISAAGLQCLPLNFKLIHCLVERCHLDHRISLRFPPSLLSASVIKLVQILLREDLQCSWSQSLWDCTGYRECDLDDCIACIQQSLREEVLKRHNISPPNAISLKNNKRVFSVVTTAITGKRGVNDLRPQQQPHKRSVIAQKVTVTSSPMSSPATTIASGAASTTPAHHEAILRAPDKKKLAISMIANDDFNFASYNAIICKYSEEVYSLLVSLQPISPADFMFAVLQANMLS